jgi:hypothetical protein
MNPYTNPYAAPQTADVYGLPVDARVDGAVVPDAIVEPLRKTRPWVTFLAIVGFLFSGLAVLVGLGMIAAGVLGGRRSELPMAGIGAFYLLFGVVDLFPSVGLLRYGSAIADLVRDPRTDRLRVALDHQRGFWKLVGIMAAVVIALYPVAIVVGVVAFALRTNGAVR